MKINKDYFALTSKLGQLKYFLRQKHVFRHIIDRIKWHYYPKWNKVAKFPTHLDVELASACQLRCPMCPTGNGMMSEQAKGTMPWWIFKKVVDEARYNNVYSIKLSWRGEPHLNKNIWKMVKYAKDIGIPDVSTLTNAAGMGEKDLVAMIDSGLDWVSFSGDGMEESYNKIRHPHTFEKLVWKIERLIELKKERGVDKPLMRIQSILSAIEHDPDEFFDFFEPLMDRVNFIVDEDRADDMRNFPRDPNFVCPNPWQRLTIGYDGMVFPCVSDYLARDPIGDVKTDFLIDVWHGKKMNELRDAHLNNKAFDKFGSCGDCCHGGLTKQETIMFRGKPKTINRYIGQNPNEQRMGGRIKQESDALWYDDVVNPERGRRKLEKSVFDKKVKK